MVYTFWKIEALFTFTIPIDLMNDLVERLIPCMPQVYDDQITTVIPNRAPIPLGYIAMIYVRVKLERSYGNQDLYIFLVSVLGNHYIMVLKYPDKKYI